MPKNNSRVILVTGATGRQGGAALRHLRERGFPVRAFTRDPTSPKAHALVGRGTEVVRGNYNDPATLTRAMDGVHGVYSVQAAAHEDVTAEIREGILVADAAKKSRVSHLVYSSVAAADRNTGIPFFDSKARIEEHIRGTGVYYSILRPVFFMENWLYMREGIEQGSLALPLTPDRRLQMIAVDDIGAFVATAFEHPGNWQGRTMDIAGDELSMSDLARAFSRMSGREVQYRQVPWDEFEQRAGSNMTRMWRWFQENSLGADISECRREYPKLTTFERWLQTHWVRRQSA
jgi:uncharacterized protein YbjT (DUF2867 family)